MVTRAQAASASPGDGWSRLGQAPPSERRSRITPTLIWDDGQIKLGHPGEFDVVVFDLSNRVRRAEIPLLAADSPERPPTIGRPGQGKLLRPRDVRFDEEQPDAPQPLRPIEDQPDGLLSRLCGSRILLPAPGLTRWDAQHPQR